MDLVGWVFRKGLRSLKGAVSFRGTSVEGVLLEVA